MLTRQHRPPCPLGPEQEIEREGFICSPTSVCTFLLIYKHWFLGAELVSESGLKESDLRILVRCNYLEEGKKTNSGKLKLLSLQWLKAPVWGVMPGKKNFQNPQGMRNLSRTGPEKHRSGNGEPS